MRAGRPSRHADPPDRFAAPQLLARGDLDPGLVQIGGDQSLAVIDQDQTALEMQIRFGEDHPAGGRRADHRPLRRGEVDAVVRPGRGPVQHPLGAPAAGDANRLQRPVEAVAEMVGVEAAGEALGLEHDLAPDAGQQLRVCRLDRRGRQAVDAGGREASGGDVQGSAGAAAGSAGLDLDAAGGVAIEADDEDAVSRGGGEGLAVDEDQGPRPGAADGVAALDETAGQGEAVGLLGAGRAGDEQGAGADQEAAAVGDHEVWPSRWKASFGPA